MMRHRNPIRGTVKHFMEAGELRQLRRISRERLSDRHSKKSNFVRFMESLQSRGGTLSMHETLYEKWTKSVRAQMEEIGTWPSGGQELSIKILAEYLSRLQAEFWKEFPHTKWYIVREDHAEYDPEFIPHRKVLKKILLKIRRKGMRDKTYRMGEWMTESVWWTWLTDYPDRHEVYNIYPFTPFNNHAADI